MAPPDPAGPANAPLKQSDKERWTKAKVSKVASERADSDGVSESRWQSVYKLFNAHTDDAKDNVFAAVNAYFAKNGSSPEGGYTKDIVASGVSVPSSAMVKITGTADGAVRKFLRGRLKDSVATLKYSTGCSEDSEMVAEALDYGLSADQAWLMADWLVPKNAYLTLEEARIAARVRDHRITKANRNRGGASVGVSGMSKVPEPESGKAPGVTDTAAAPYIGATFV